MPYDTMIPAEGNALRGVSGDIALVQENFDILSSLVSGMTAPSQGAPMRELVVTSGANAWGLGWNGNSGALTYNGVKVIAANNSAFTFLVPVGSNVAATTDTHLVRRAEIKTETLGGHVVTLASGSIFALDERAMYGYTIDEFHAQTASGTIDVTLKIGAVTVSGLNGITISGTQSSTDTTAAFTVVSGDRVTMVLGADVGTPSDLSFTIKTARSA